MRKIVFIGLLGLAVAAVCFGATAQEKGDGVLAAIRGGDGAVVLEDVKGMVGDVLKGIWKYED